MIGIASAFGVVFTAISGIAQGWFKHKQAKTEAARDVELANIGAQVDIQRGSWKDEYFTIFWTAPLYPPLWASIWNWNPQIFIDYVTALPGWYTTILIGMTTASFGVKTFKDWKAGVLDREIIWDTHTKNGKNGGRSGGQPVVKEKPLPGPDVRDEYLRGLEGGG